LIESGPVDAGFARHHGSGEPELTRAQETRRLGLVADHGDHAHGQLSASGCFSNRDHVAAATGDQDSDRQREAAASVMPR
jgi:hypothetical protein